MESLKEIDKNLKIKINRINILGVIGEKRKIEFISLIKSKYPLCKVNFKKNTPINDFKKLWNSKVIISSNSTFSFWASIYGNSDIVFLPLSFSKFNTNKMKKLISFI